MAEIDGKVLVETLKRLLQAGTDRELARRLGVTNVTLHNWRKPGALNARRIAQQMARMARDIVSGDHVIAKVKRKLRAKTLGELAAMLGVTGVYLFHLRRQPHLTEGQIAGILASTSESARNSVYAGAIRPIVEFLPIRRGDGKGRQHFLQADRRRGEAHPYLAGLRKELENSHGIYVFFDSRGRALYAGKAKRKSLYSEMLSAFNRDRDVQNIWRVRHPKRRVAYKPAEEKSRQIGKRSVKLHELAEYASAYEVPEGLIDELESLLIRSFPNDLMTTRMEKFGVQRRTKAGRKR